MCGFKAAIKPVQKIGGNIGKPKTVVDSDYTLLENKPSINGVTVEGDKSFEDYGLLFDGKTIVEENGVLAVADGSHGHTVENIEGLQEALEAAEIHASNEDNPHNVTKTQLGLENVENKSSATIRGELEKGDVTKALGYTPPTENTTYDAATQSTDGLMSSVDKKKLDGIAEGANNYAHPAYNAKASGLYKVTVDATGHISGTEVVTKSDITALGIPAQDTNTTYGAATQSTNGLMSSADKKKLDGIAEGAQVNSITGVKGGAESSYRTGQINITAANIGLGNVENKSSATIRGELTKDNVTKALGYTPSSETGAVETVSSAVRRQARPSDLFKIL